MDFLEFKIAKLSELKFFFSSVGQAIFPLPPCFQTFLLLFQRFGNICSKN